MVKRANALRVRKNLGQVIEDVGRLAIPAAGELALSVVAADPADGRSRAGGLRAGQRDR
ncbi:MAG: hypothetical protein Q8Q58_06355 [Candidatus Rokubacteria bacterium]|nr:hypothetical protein [Candidatus Rokubacteria bacterium]